jgi:ribosome-binding factor A
VGRYRQAAGEKGKSDGRRVQRVEKEIREVIGAYLLRGFRGQLPGLVSISRVIVSKDLRTAKVLVTLMVQASVEPSLSADKTDEVIHQSRKLTIEELQAHAHEIQTEINLRLKMKHCPRLTFIYDDGLEHALKVDQILRDLEKSRNSNSGGDDEK